MSRAFSADHTPAGMINLMHLTKREYELVKDGLACLLAALPAQHSGRPEVIDLIDALRESE